MRIYGQMVSQRPPFFNQSNTHRKRKASKISERTVRSGALPRKKPLQEYLTKFASHWGAQAADQPWELSAKFVLALFGSICFSFGGSRAAFAINAPPATEDKLLEVVRVVENRLDTATQLVGEVLSSITRAPPTRDLQDNADPQQWRALVDDVWEVVDNNFMDARSAGFDRERWRQLRDDVLSKPLASRAAAHGAIRDMVRSGLRDPYSRFISPQEFAAMLKYDVSGVGLNLGTAEEFVNKTGIPLPGRTIPSTAAHHDAAAASLASRDGSQNNLAVIQAGSTFPADAASVGPGAGVGVVVGQVAASPSAKDASSIQPPSSHGAAARGGEGSAGRDGGGVYVLGLIRGLAGDAAGIEQGDEVVAVGGRDVGGRTPFEVASILAGAEEAGEEPPGSSRADLFGQTSQEVVLQVRKYSSGDVVDVVVERPVRVIPSPVTARLERQGDGKSLPAFLFATSNVGSGSSSGEGAAQAGGGSAGSSRQQGGSVGYIKLSSFNARAQRDVAAAVRKLEGEGATRIVLDLRDNRGGLVSEGIEVAKLFLQDNALVVRTAGKARGSSAPIIAPGPALSAAPLVVLVNEHTASASEILAGALQDNCRAVLAGKRTFGKGLIQSVYELGDGSGLVLTVGKYMTPRGIDIDREGIQPQFKSVPSSTAAGEAIEACRLLPPNQPVRIGSARHKQFF